MSDLNAAQRKAVETLKGPVLVLAGAGSGKTRVIAYRVANLIHTGTCKPWEIMAVTFTNKAADEMRARVHGLIGLDGHDVVLGTFHRTCAQILRKWGQAIGVPQEYVILDDTESKVLVKRIMKGLGIDIKHFDPKAVHNRISTAKGNLINWRTYQERAVDRWEELVGQTYEGYQHALEQAKSLDFDDLIMKAVELMEESPRTLEHLQNRYKCIQVDEYQDINKAQYVLTKTLASRDHNICVVGDDDQSIYAFRGADPKYIINFEDDFPGAVVVKLEENYRSMSYILDAANAIVKNNPKRHYKKLFTNRGEGVPNIFKFNRTDEAEAIDIAENIEFYIKKEDRSFNDFAVLYRTNAISRIFEEVFTQYAIPYQIIGGFRFYDRKEVKDVLAYLKLIQNPWDTVSLQRIINTPTRGIGEKSFTRLVQLMSEYNFGIHELPEREELWIRLGSYAGNRVVRFAEMIKVFHEDKDSYSVHELTGMILDESGYQKRLEESDTIEAESRLENIAELLGAIDHFDEAYPTEGLPVFLEQVALIQSADDLDRDADSVKCLTAHSAKGLEFGIVFVAGMEDGLFPHSRSYDDPNGLEEERRLAYVSITRARDRLFLSAAYKRSSAFWRERSTTQIGSTPSRFLSEIPDNLIETNDPESERALKGYGEPTSKVPEHFQEQVKKEYSEMGDGWTVLPGAYKFAEAQGGLAKAKVGSRSRRSMSDEGPREPSSYKIGDMVRHEKFGEGKVVKIQPAGGGDYFLQINFRDEGAKLLSEQKAPLERIEGNGG